MHAWLTNEQTNLTCYCQTVERKEAKHKQDFRSRDVEISIFGYAASIWTLVGGRDGNF